MGVFAWFAGLVARSRRAQSKFSRWDRESLAPMLRVRRLEERRVLNADAVPVDQLVVDAGSDGGDGQADTFHIEQDAERVRVSVNGQEVANAALSDIGGISIRGSLDDDILLAEFKGGEPLAGLELLFDGGEGGNDSLTLGGEAGVDEINYSFGESGENRIQINSADGSAQIAYRGVEAVDDQLVAADRNFRFEDDGQDVTLDDAGGAHDDVSRLLVADAANVESDLVVSFRNPSESLVIDNSARQEEADSVSLAGLDGRFDADLRVVGSSDDSLSIGGSITVGQGDVDLVSGSIMLRGRISTNAASVSFAASHEVNVGVDSGVFNSDGTITIDAPRIEQDGVLLAAGGQVKLDSGDGGITIVRGLVDVSQSRTDGPAGSVHVLGSYVGLFDNAQVYAAAALGGGTVLIGGDYQGKNPAIRNAARTYVGANAVIRADAQVSGDGGKVVVWADEVTRFYGTISARGGSDAGNGGFAEVSGKNVLDYGGFTDLTAARGERGTLLLDPKNITIENGGADVVATNDEFTEAAAANRSFDASLIVAALAGANVELQANNDITINEAIDATGNNNPGNLTLRAGRSVIINANVAIEGTLTVTANDAGAQAANRDAGDAQITVLPGVTLDTSDTNGDIILQYGNGPNGNDATGAMTVGILDAGTGAITLNTTANDGGAASLENITVASVSDAAALTIVNSAATTFTGAVTAGTVTITDTTGTVAFQGVTALGTLTTANQGYNVAFTGATTTVTNDANFLNTGSVTLGDDAADVTTFTGGVATTGNASNPSGTNLAGSIVTADAALDIGAVTLTADTTIDTNATTTAGDITLGAVTGGGFDLTLETGAGIAGADVSGASVSGVDALALQNIGGTASFTGAITAATLTVPATVNNVSLTGTGSTVTNTVSFANTGTLVLGQAAGTQTYNGGVSRAGAGATTLNGTIAISDDAITFGAVTLGSNVVLNTNATTGAGDITLGAVTGGGFDLTLETGAGVAGADVTGTSISAVDVLALQNIGGTASFTGALTVATLTVPATVNNVSLTGTGSTVTNTVTFANAGTLVLGQAGGTQNYNGGLSTAAVGGTVTIGGTIATTNDPITFGPVTLGSDTILDTNATSAAGDITLGAVTGGGFDLTLVTGAGVAGADVSGTSVSGVDALALQNIGGTASFTGAITTTSLTVPATVNNVSLTGTGSTVTNAVTFANAGSLVLGQAGGTQTYNGGVSRAGAGATTLNGTIAASDDPITFGAVTLGSSVVLNSGGGAIITGAIEGTAVTDDLTITSTGGTTNTVAVGAIGAGGNVNTVQITAGATITLGGNITTSNAAGNTVTLQAPTINMGAFTIDTNNVAFDGDVTFITNLLQNPGAVDAGTATFRISPFTATHVIEFAANNSATIVENAFYDSDFANIVAGQFIIGGVGQTGDIHIGNDLAALTFNFDLTAQTAGAGMVFVNSDYTSAGGDLTLLSGMGVTLRDLSADATATINLGAGAFSATGNATIAENLVAITAGGGITFNNNIDADNAAANDRALSLNSSTTGTISVLGNIGAAQPLAGLTIVQSNGATFAGSVNVTDSATGTITITDTVNGQTVAFQGSVSADLLVVNNGGADNYNVAITGAVNSIGGTTTFANGGTLTLGDEATDSTTFADGVTAVAPTAVSIAGVVAATNAASTITLGDANTGVTVTANATVGGTATGTIDLGDATINNGVTLTVGTGNSNQIDLDAVSGVAGGAASNLTLNTTGAVTVAEAVGTDIGTLTITQSGGTTFQDTVDAASVVIDDTDDGQTVAFLGNLTAGALAANNGGADNYNVAISGAVNSIGGTTTFANGGTLTLGDQATDSTTFTGGVTATAPSAIDIAGTVAATAGASAITLGDANTGVTVTADATVGGTATGAIDLGDATINDGLTLSVGTGVANTINLDAVSGVAGGVPSDLTLNTTGIVTVAEAVGTDIGTVTITQSGGTMFQGAFTATNAVLTDTADGQTIAFEAVTSITNLTTAAQGYNVAFRGSTTTVANDTNFLNTGTVTLGNDAADVTTFTNGLDTTTGPSGTNVAGAVATVNTQMDLGGTTMTADAALRSGSGAINVASITDDVSSFSLDLQDNTAASTGTVTFNGNVTINDLDTFGQNYTVRLLGTASVIDTDTNFLNIGTLMLGDAAGDSNTFAGGLATTGNATNPALVNIAGTVATVNSQMDLGAITLTADSVLDTGTAATSVMNVGAVTSGGNALTLDSGPNAAADITVASFAGNGNLTVIDSGGTTFTGPVTSNTVTLNDTTGAIAFQAATTITTLVTFGQPYDVAFTGATTNVTNDATFINSGAVTLGNDVGDATTFTGGLDTTTPSGTNVAGTVSTTNTQMDLGTTTMTANTTLRSGSGLLNVGSITDGAAALSLAVQDNTAASTGAVTFLGAVSINELATFAQPYNVALQGTTSTITLHTTFANTGALTIGNDAGDNSTFEQGVTATAPSSVSIAGNVAATVGASTITLGDANTGVTVTQNATVGGTATGLIDLGDATINDARLLTVGTGIANAINLDAISGVALGLASDVTINTTSNVTVAEAVGTDIGMMRIEFANNFTAMSTIEAVRLQQDDGTGTTELQGNVTTATTSVVTNTIRLHNVQVLATSAALGALVLDVDQLANFDFMNALLTTGNGQISEQVLERDATTGEFTALDNSINTGVPIVGATGTGEIQVEVVDSNGQNFTITIDWLEGINTNALTNRIVVSPIDGTPPPVNALSFQHEFNSVPEEITPGGFVPVPVRISNFAGNAIQLSINNANVLNFANGTQGQVGIETTVFVPFAGAGLVTILPTPEPLPRTAEAPPTLFASFEFQSQPLQRGDTTFVESTAGTVVRGEDRYYVLRIVSFDENGELVETDTGESIRLDNRALKAIYPFDPSKLPALFGRLPADRYRIYLIEDGTERLVLDFIIHQGQPIEVPEDFEGDMEELPADPTDVNGAARESFEAEQLTSPAEADLGRALPGLTEQFAGQSLADNLSRFEREPAWSRFQAAESFAERLGQASFLSHGGIMVGAAAVAAATTGRWEKSMDRVMEQFGRRRPFTRRRKVTRQFNGAGDHAPRTSLSLKD